MSSTSPNVNPKLPLLTRFSYNVQLFLFSTLGRIFFALHNIFKKPLQGTVPTLIKSYPSTAHLRNRIFYPPTYDPSSKPLPLYLTIHGGAFIFGEPSLDDAVNAKVCSEWNVLVIALDYPKSPSVKYPIPTQQLVVTISSILSDETLAFDRQRVAIGGYSAGGQLALSVCLDHQLQGKIHAVIPFYPPVDFVESAAVKKNTRPYAYEDEVDKLTKIVPLAKYAYCSVGQDLRAPGLSPAFAAREDLPAWICAVGAELDILANEAGAMMGRLAGKKLVKVGETEGLGGSDQAGFEADEGRLKWVLARGAPHGFTHAWGGAPKIDTEGEAMDANEVFKNVGEWLLNGPFRPGK